MLNREEKKSFIESLRRNMAILGGPQSTLYPVADFSINDSDLEDVSLTLNSRKTSSGDVANQSDEGFLARLVLTLREKNRQGNTVREVRLLKVTLSATGGVSTLSDWDFTPFQADTGNSISPADQAIIQGVFTPDTSGGTNPISLNYVKLSTETGPLDLDSALKGRKREDTVVGSGTDYLALANFLRTLDPHDSTIHYRGAENVWSVEYVENADGFRTTSSVVRVAQLGAKRLKSTSSRLTFSKASSSFNFELSTSREVRDTENSVTVASLSPIAGTAWYMAANSATIFIEPTTFTPSLAEAEGPLEIGNYFLSTNGECNNGMQYRSDAVGTLPGISDGAGFFNVPFWRVYHNIIDIVSNYQSLRVRASVQQSNGPAWTIATQAQDIEYLNDSAVLFADTDMDKTLSFPAMDIDVQLRCTGKATFNEDPQSGRLYRSIADVWVVETG